MGELTPQMNLIQMSTMKVAPKIHFAILKTPINWCDHISSDVDSKTCSKNFQKFKQELGINKIPLFEFEFKYFEFQKCSELGSDYLHAM